MSKRRKTIKFPKVTCACGCGRRFVKSTYNRIYARVECKNIVGQRLVRARAKGFPERAAEQLGAMGSQGRQP